MKKIYIIGVAALFLAACKPSININKNASAGLADFTNYLAIGNSLTAGYSDGSLTVDGQLNSYPERLFEQFSLIPVHGANGQFIQPRLNGNDGYPSPKFVLAWLYNACIPGDSSLGPVRFQGVLDSANDYVYNATTNNGQINNIGVPGIRVADYKVANYALIAKSFGSPYAARFYHDLSYSPLQELNFMVGNLHPTFFTMWLGANDVLGYALNGGQGKDAGTAVPIAPNLFATTDITPITTFDSCYDAALNVAISTGASGALINIPDITSIPYFNTIPANGLVLTRQGQADTLNAIYAPLFAKNVFQLGANFFIIQDHQGKVRQAIPGELILLSTSQDALTCNGLGSLKPISDSFVLTTDEIQFIQTATTAYNGFIKQEADLHHLAYVDMNAYFKTLPSGMTFNGITYNTQFVTGGAFSLDGIHPTQRGYALIANYIIGTINSFYKSAIPSIDANKYKGISFP